MVNQAYHLTKSNPNTNPDSHHCIFLTKFTETKYKTGLETHQHKNKGIESQFMNHGDYLEKLDKDRILS